MEASPRERLLDAADTLMYEQGYESVGVAELCRVADTRKGSFYHFFDSKQALALAMLDRSWERTRSTIFAALDDPTMPTIEAIEIYGELLIDNLKARQTADAAIVGCRFGNFAVELSTRDEAIRSRVVEIFGEMTEVMITAIERGIDNGEFDDSIDAASSARALIAYMEGLMVMAKAHRDPNRLADLGRFARLILDES